MTKLKTVLLVLLLALVGAACGDDGDSDNNGGGPPDTNAPNQKVGGTAEQGRNLKLVAAGKITVCSDVPYAPFEYEEDGKVVGIDADIMRAVGGRLGLIAEFRDTDFSGIFAAMEAGQCDVIASSVSITDERKKTLDFSDGYYDIVQSLLVRKADESKYADLPALRGRTVGVQSGTTGLDYAKAQSGANGYTVKEFEGADDLFAALKSSQVDAVLQDFPVNAYNAKVSGETVVTKKFEDQKEQYGIVLKKGRDDLKKAINDALARIRQDDTYNSILRTYLGQQ
ncbi:MAG TPA: transporter substrate-binding domain-containing protein [Acidimicrobiales bacterium]|nr:transporter substrate-binding domain-containing protein [Acidimicrobiales bacterium]